MSNANRIYERSTRASLYNENKIEFVHEPMFLGAGRNTQRFETLKYDYFDKSNDTQQGFDWKHDEISLIKDIKDFKGPMTIAERFVVTRTFQKLIFLDSLNGRGPFLTLGQIATLPELENVILTWNYFEACLVPDTEVLTSTGWKYINEITLNDKVMCCDIDGCGQFKEPKKLHTYNYSGFINKFEGKNVSQHVTDQHRMLLINRNSGEREVKRVQDISIHKNGKTKYHLVNALSSTINKTILSDYDRFLIALQADGSIKREKKSGDKVLYKNQNGAKTSKISCVFTFVKQRKIERFTKLLEKLNFDYSVKNYKNNCGNTTTSFRVAVPMDLIISKSFKDWVNLETISYDWAREFINEIKHWDGWDYDNPTFGYDTVIKDNADMVEIIAAIGGYKVSYNTQIQSHKDCLPLYRLSFNSKKNYSVNTSINVSREKFEGKVHCLTVDGGFFMIRHHGKISITGNCKHSRTYTEELRALYDNPSEIFDESFNLPELTKISGSIRKPFERAYFNIIGYIYNIQRDIEITDEQMDELKTSIIMLIIEINSLEGIRFYSSFAAVWALTEGQKYIPGTSENLSFICLHPESQVLTSTGWKYVEDLQLTDKICQYDMDSGKTSFDFPSRKIWIEYEGEMYKITDTKGNVIQHITKDHEVVVQRIFKGKTTSVSKLPVQDLNFGPSVYFPQGGELENTNSLKVTTLDRFRIMVQADGYINPRITGKHKGFHNIVFSLGKERKIELLKQYCDELNFDIIERDSINSTRSFSVNVPEELNISKDLNWINLDSNIEYIDEILMELVKWDGSIATEKSNDKFAIFTSEQHIHDVVVALISLSSYKLFNYKQVNKGKESYKLSHRIYFRKDPKVINTQKYNMEVYHYKGMIGCVTMPKGTIITKSKNDKICVTSNCRDENEHLALTQNILKNLRRKEQENFVKYYRDCMPDIEKRYIEVYNEELEWIDFLFSQGSYIGMNSNILKQYLTFITIKRMKGIGIKVTKEMLSGNWCEKNPLPWIDKYINMDLVEKLPQEEKVLNYVTGGVDQDIDVDNEHILAKEILGDLF